MKYCLCMKIDLAARNDTRGHTGHKGRKETQGTQGDTRGHRGHKGTQGTQGDTGHTWAETSLPKTKRKIYKTKTG